MSVVAREIKQRKRKRKRKKTESLAAALSYAQYDKFKTCTFTFVDVRRSISSARARCWDQSTARQLRLFFFVCGQAFGSGCTQSKYFDFFFANAHHVHTHSDITLHFIFDGQQTICYLLLSTFHNYCWRSFFFAARVCSAHTHTDGWNFFTRDWNFQRNSSNL